MSTIEDRLREGARDVQAALETVPTRPLRQRNYGPWAAIAAAVAVLLLVGLPVLLFAQSGAPQQDVATEVTPSPNREGSTGLPWECPSVEPTEDVQLDAAEVPDALRYLPSNGTPDSAWGINYGPNCFRGPALIAARFADATKTSATALVVVWVETQTSEHPPSDPSVATTLAQAPRPGETVTQVDGFTVRHFQRPVGVDQVEATGEVNGLPVFIEATGITPDGLMALVSQMEGSRTTGEVALTGSDLEVVHQAPVKAVVADVIAWYAEGPEPGQSLEVRTYPGFHSFVSARGVIHGVEFAPVGDGVGVAVSESGQSRLTWEIQPGVVAHLSDEVPITDLVRIAEALVPAEADGDGLEPPSVAAQPFATLPIDEVRTIRGTAGRLVAECMIAAGYNEFGTVDLGSAAAASTTLNFAPLLPHEFGPATLSAASEKGFDPTTADPDPPYPKVISGDDPLTTALSQCQSEAWDQLGPTAEGTVAALEALEAELSNEMIFRLSDSPEAQTIFGGRTSCLADAGYPVSSEHPILFRPEPEDIGVPFGNVVPTGPSDANSGSVFSTPPTEEYRPTRQEIDLAVTDFKCRRDMDFFARIVQVAIPIQEELLAEHDAELRGLSDQISLIMERVSVLGN